MGTDTPGSAPAAGRPRPILLALLGIALVAFLLMRLGGSAGPSQPASNAPVAQQTAGGTQVDPAMLEVNLEALEGERPPLDSTQRNPFRFEPKPQAAPPPASGIRSPLPEERPGPSGPAPSPMPPPPPPITVRFIGRLDREDGSRVAVFVDCTVGRRTSHAQEGGIVDGRYRLVNIGLESVVIEHLDGRGRTTLAQTGQECAGK